MKTWTRAWALASVLATSGCLMPSPPELSDPEQTRPYVHYLTVDPPLGEPIQVTLGDTQSVVTIPILLPFQSEDLGEDITGSLYLYDTNNTAALQFLRSHIPAGEFSTVRNADLPWSPRKDLAAGCYRLTATLAHDSSFGDNGIVREEFLYDAEAVSWLVNIVRGADQTEIKTCPRVGDVN